MSRLLDDAAAEMRARGMFAISVYGVGARMNALLDSCGFKARDADKTLMVDAVQAPIATRAALLDAASWYVADGGEDM
jgi:hypothetical protein